MKIAAKIFFLMIFFLNLRLLGTVSIICPEGKIYFSKNILFSKIVTAKTQLFLAYSYYFNEFSSVDSDAFEKLSKKERVKKQALFHDMKHRYEVIFKELDFLRVHSGKDVEEINFICFESLIKNLALIHDFFNYVAGDLKLFFKNHRLLNQDVLKKINSNNEKVGMTFNACCDLIEELFIFNDDLIKQNVSLPPDDLFDGEIPFYFGYLEYSSQDKFPVPSGYLFVNFQNSTY